MTVEQRIKDRAIGIVGMARSGIAAALLAQRYGGNPFVSDAAEESKLTDALREVKREGIPFETDGHTDRLLACDYLVVSPGVPPDADIIKRAGSAGIPVFSEIEFASWVCRGRIIAVTGSNGKTTTTTLLGQMLSAAGFETCVGGNIGKPFSSIADKVTEDGIAVVEVSSFQLERIEQFKPHVAIILNLTPDHLDRHGSFDAYKKAKYEITANQSAEDWLIVNADDRELSADNVETAAVKLWFAAGENANAAVFVRNESLHVRSAGSERMIIATSDIGIKGPHNLQNAAAALCAANCVKANLDAVADSLRRFTGVEHRLEDVGAVAGVKFINDSKATNVDSVCWALRSMTTPVYLIAGGRDKGGDFSQIAAFGRGKIKGIIALGEARQKIFDALGKSFPVQFAGSMKEAVGAAFDQAHPGETTLLSPGCASFDMYKDFEQRGHDFKAAVDGLKNGKEKNESITS
jgi:UDP-N-acetylmuramoylalanine--D-glutamate ligase